MGQPGAIEIIIAKGEDLGLALQAPERTRMNYTGIIKLIVTARVVDVQCLTAATFAPDWIHIHQAPPPNTNRNKT